ncbi:MAG: hydroxyacid dehydrogenase [Ruminococcaceae bacterium]|nr:hydroxyacid dehydrogenase [Oscillospiraceae bacterium]
MNLLITGAFSCTKEELDCISQLGFSIVYMQDEKGGVPCSPESVCGTICNGLFLHHPIEQFSNLRFIQLTSAGLDRVPLDYIREHGIRLFNAGGVYSAPIAEFVLSGILDFYKKKPLFWESQKAKKWNKQRDLLELTGKKVCIVGCGSVGRECAKRLKAFDTEIIGVDPLKIENTLFDRVVDIAFLDEVLQESNIVVLTLPLTKETYHLFDKKRFAGMKDQSLLVNVSRGAVVDQSALAEALKTKLLGAVIDVLEEEPLPADSELWSLENILITPHNSFVGENNHKRLLELILKNLKK